jgi:hypothetical protein
LDENFQNKIELTFDDVIPFYTPRNYSNANIKKGQYVICEVDGMMGIYDLIQKCWLFSPQFYSITHLEVLDFKNEKFVLNFLVESPGREIYFVNSKGISFQNSKLVYVDPIKY